MFLKNTALAYPVLLITSIKKNFESLAKKVNKSGKTIARWLGRADWYYDQTLVVMRYEFRHRKRLFLILDDTLIKKIYSQLIEGCGYFYDTKCMRRIMAYKLLVAMLSDGKQAIPFQSTLLFAKELLPSPQESKDEWIKKIIGMVQELFPGVEIVVTADGAFSNKDFLGWCSAHKIAAEMRIRSNCVVAHKGEKSAIRDIKCLRPRGRQMARTITVEWHKIALYITAHRRIDKHGSETIVYLAATFQAKPMDHVRIYRIRWNIEKFFRTAKQSLGLQECLSTKLETQTAHIASVLLAYTLIQSDRKKQKLLTPEAAIRAAERKKGASLYRYIHRLSSLFDTIRG